MRSNTTTHKRSTRHTSFKKRFIPMNPSPHFQSWRTRRAVDHLSRNIQDHHGPFVHIFVHKTLSEMNFLHSMGLLFRSPSDTAEISRLEPQTVQRSKQFRILIFVHKTLSEMNFLHSMGLLFCSPSDTAEISRLEPQTVQTPYTRGSPSGKR
jgi:hypothetical protein